MESPQEGSPQILPIVVAKELQETGELSETIKVPLKGNEKFNSSQSLNSKIIDVKSNNCVDISEKSLNESRVASEIETRKTGPQLQVQTNAETTNNSSQATSQTGHTTTYVAPNMAANLQSTAFHPTYQAIAHELFDPQRISRAMEEYNSLRAQQQPTRILERDKISSDSTKPQVANFSQEERYHLMFERETKWSEVRKYSEFIRRFATEASHMEITKENYYDLYNMAVCLLKSVDSLDPDKIHNIVQRKGSDFDLSSQISSTNSTQIPVVNTVPATALPTSHNPQQTQSELELLQARKSFDYYYNRSGLDSNFVPKYTGEVPLFYNNQAVPTFMNPVIPAAYQAIPKGDALKQQKNYSGEVFFDDLQQQEDGNSRRPKRRRRRTVYSSRRNLHCHMCGVTETPEWRRGPAGDHTLCNACGLHYAKSLKKQRKEREGRKHSIEMLLNQANPNANNEAT